MDGESDAKVRLILAIEDLEVYQVGGSDGQLVVHRKRADGNDLWDCGCSQEGCGHIAAVRGSIRSRTSEIDDPETIAALEEEIEGFTDRLFDHPDYLSEEEANEYYLRERNRAWRKGEYFSENLLDYPNTEAERECMRDLGTRILEGVRDPHRAIRMFCTLFRQTEELDYDYGGFKMAVRDMKGDLWTVFSQADADDLFFVLSEGRNTWAEDMIGRLPPAVVEGAYVRLRDSHSSGLIAQGMMFDRGDFEDYVASGGNALEAARELVKTGENGRAGRICLSADPDRMFDDQFVECASIMRGAGMTVEAGLMYMNSYDRYAGKDALKGLESCTAEAPELMDRILDAEGSAEHPGAATLAFLIDHGRKEAARIAIDAGAEAFLNRYEDTDIIGLTILFRSLMRARMYREAAAVGRGAVEAHLAPGGGNLVYDTVDLAVLMGSYRSLEKVDPPHSVWLKGLRSRYPQASKFWSEYDRAVSGDRRRGRDRERIIGLRACCEGPIHSHPMSRYGIGTVRAGAPPARRR